LYRFSGSIPFSDISSFKVTPMREFFAPHSVICHPMRLMASAAKGTIAHLEFREEDLS
jgi:hypothetical protein